MPFIIDARNMGGGSIGSAAGGDTSTGTRNNVTLAAPWDENKEYLKGDLATNNGDLYQAQKSVPAGVKISDEDYWALVVAGDKSKETEQLRKDIGSLADLETEAKENLVAAINEVAKSGGESYTLPQATAEALGGVKADPATESDTQPVRIGNDGKLVTAARKSDISLGLTSAAVGQTIKVKAVDESGKPTAWEAADMPSGGGHWETVLEKPFDTIDGNTLVNRSGTLCVNTTDNAEQDNTRPITSSGVHVICGNINALLQAI